MFHSKFPIDFDDVLDTEYCTVPLQSRDTSLRIEKKRCYGMYGVFCFENLQKLFFHVCDDELLALIVDNQESCVDIPVIVSKSTKTATIRSQNDSAEHILYFFTPLLASHMFLTSELSDGLRIMEGANQTQILFFRVFEYTCVLLTVLPSHYANFVALTVKRLLRLVLASFAPRIASDECHNETEEGLLLRSAILHLEEFVRSDPAFVFPVEECSLLPDHVVRICKSALKTISNLHPFRYSVKDVRLFRNGKSVALHNHDRSDSKETIDPHDIRLLPLMFQSPISSKTVSQDFVDRSPVPNDSSTEKDDPIFTTLGTPSTSSQSTSFSLLPDVAQSECSVPSVSVLPNWSFMTLFFRHTDGAVRPHRVYLLRIPSSFQLILISHSHHSYLMPLLYDTLQILANCAHMTKYKETRPDKKELLALKEIINKILRCPESNQLSPGDMNTLSRLRSTITSVFSAPTWSTYALYVQELRKIIFSQMNSSSLDVQSNEAWRTLMLGMKDAEQILTDTLKDLATFIVMKLPMKIAVSDVLRDCGDVIYFVFVDREEERGLSSQFPRAKEVLESDTILNDISRILEMCPFDSSINRTSLFGDASRICSYCQFSRSPLPNVSLRQSSPAESAKRTAYRYELFTWHGPSTSDNRIRNLQQRLIDRLTQLTTTTSVRPRKQSSFIARLLLT